MAKSLRLGDFPRAETSALLAHYTAETGPAFDLAALDAVWTQTRGQPWLVNALAAETCFEKKAGRDCSRPVTADAGSAAREHNSSCGILKDSPKDTVGEDRVVTNLDSSLQRIRASHKLSMESTN